MAIPLSYSLRNIRARWTSSMAATIGIVGTVGVFVTMLSLAHGFKAAVVNAGSPANAIVRRAGSQMELDSTLTLEEVNAIGDALAGIVPGAQGNLVSPEVVVIGDFPLKGNGLDAHVQLRGVSPKSLAVRDSIHLISGRFLQPGLNELVLGRNVAANYSSFDIGKVVRFGGAEWTVVGVFDAGGTAFDSEVWADSSALTHGFQRTQGTFQSVTIRSPSADVYQRLKDRLTSDPRLAVQVDRERDYYEKQSRVVTNLLLFVGLSIGGIMAVGAVVGALNTMYSMVTERNHEIACLRAIGFGEGSVVAAIVLEALFIAVIGGVCGCIFALQFNGLTTRVLNPQTQSHMAFTFQVTPPLLLLGLGFAVLMGLIGGLPPAIRAARARIAVVLREL
jgi:putative ABC transport system permease protein